jgi:hypothetical protein
VVLAPTLPLRIFLHYFRFFFPRNNCNDNVKPGKSSSKQHKSSG